MTPSDIAQTLDYVKRFSGSTVLIKLGGSVLHDMDLVKQLCEDLSSLRAVGISLILVHGGSKAINAALDKHDIRSHIINGLRVTSPEAMDVIESTLAGQVNKLLVRTLNAVGVKAVGLCGFDGGLLRCKAMGAEFERVGEITTVNTELVQQLIDTQAKPNSGKLFGDIANTFDKPRY